MDTFSLQGSTRFTLFFNEFPTYSPYTNLVTIHYIYLQKINNFCIYYLVCEKDIFLVILLEKS